MALIQKLMIQQGKKLHEKFSRWQKISIDMVLVPILGLLLFNIFISDLFHFIENTILRKYADNNTIYSSNKNANIVISRLRHDFAMITDWFYENWMITTIENVTLEKIVGIAIDNKLNWSLIWKINAKMLTKNSVHSQKDQN